MNEWTLPVLKASPWDTQRSVDAVRLVRLGVPVPVAVRWMDLRCDITVGLARRAQEAVN